MFDERALARERMCQSHKLVLTGPFRRQTLLHISLDDN
jgi:hypothetical protein